MMAYATMELVSTYIYWFEAKQIDHMNLVLLARSFILDLVSVPNLLEAV